VSNVRLLKKLIAVVSLLAAGLAGGGFLGFALGYVIAGEGRNNIHGDAILVGLLTISGAIAGLIVGTLTAYRVGQRVT
jgi:tetrahydromethanopterin S-methyltransferase subunit F